MKKKLFGFFRSNRKGLALITVLGVVTLATILIMALFSVSDAEFKASKAYLAGSETRQLADSAVNLVIGQIQAAATGDGVSPSMKPTIWASQPGAARVYSAGGVFQMGRRLYSSPQMVFPGGSAAQEMKFQNDMPGAGWKSNPSMWVDMNEPVIQVPPGGTTPQTYFPIIDPRAKAKVGEFEPIEGFDFRDSAFVGSGTVEGVVSTGPNADEYRVPMPVQWLYVLKDGSLGTVNSNGEGQPATWNSVPGAGAPSPTNPIVGRIAFWTDDESCKVNLNTAGEPGQWQLPYVFHDRDKKWADAPPVSFEYQRWPGHPATVALSSILFPNATEAISAYDGDSYSSTGALTGYINLKNSIYELAPWLSIGGSLDGTLAFATDYFSSAVTPDMTKIWLTAREAMQTERQFVNVDEMIFQQTLRNGIRVPSDVTYDGKKLVSAELLRRARFFLTANSRAPELNMFGLPRVAIWPVHAPISEGTERDYRTPYDEAIAKAATLGGLGSRNTYYFGRRDYASSITDMGGDLQAPDLIRNKQLMAYLDKMMQQTMPGGASFHAKYGTADARQILVEIFDYIRSTNLYDSFLDDRYFKTHKRDKWDNNGASEATKYNARLLTSPTLLWTERPKDHSYYTFTPPRFNTIRRVGDLTAIPPQFQKDFQDEDDTPTGAYPGHGQVKPIEWSIGGQTYKGFGRFPTISEVALHFICTGDGKTDAASYKLKNAAGEDIRSGGKTAQKINPAIANSRYALIEDVTDPAAFWYSNIPPYPKKTYFEKAGCDFGKLLTGAPNDPARHPGWNSANWNCTLEYNEEAGGIALQENERRIQVAMELELFVPAVGYTKYVPDFTIVLNGRQLANIEAQDVTGVYRSLFQTTADQVVQSTTNYMGSTLGENADEYGVNSVNPMGGWYGTKPLMRGRNVKSVGGRMPRDPAYQDEATASVHNAMANFPLVSNPFTVQRDQPIKFRAKGGTGIQADIYASHDWQGKEDRKNSKPVQSVMIKFPDGEHQTPCPWLVVYSTERVERLLSDGTFLIRNAVNACRWWAFNSGGAVGRYTGRGEPNGEDVDWSRVKEDTSGNNNNGAGTWGRFRGEAASSVPTQDPFNDATKTTPANVAMGGIIYGYADLPDFRGTKSTDKDLQNGDIYIPGGKDQNGARMGGYGFYGTDSVRSIVPRHGDYRILAAMRSVPATIWEPHRLWNTTALFAHSLSGNTANVETGFDTGYNPASEGSNIRRADNRLVANTWYPDAQVPDVPLTGDASKAVAARGDFDNGPGDFRDGPFINKPDDGNLSVAKFWYGAGPSAPEGKNQFLMTRNAYFMGTYLQMPSTNAYFTPNRMIPSPGVFGSLPTGVFGGGQTARGDGKARSDGIPFQTLLFRANTSNHPGGPGWSGGIDPADHYVMDLFWMPVVQPYLISDSYSTAGKINVNYQIMPFLNIKRATGLHAAIKGELITAISNHDGDPESSTSGEPSKDNPVIYKMFKDDPNLRRGNRAVTPRLQREFWKDSDQQSWHRHIDRAKTLSQWENRMGFASDNLNSGGLMRTASQVCELHLIPRPGSHGNEPSVGNGDKISMDNFWKWNNLTGDNLREGPYANIYQKLTNRSNTFRVYFRVQTLKKARSLPPTMVDETKDTVTAEYRGSSLLERYLNLDSSSALTDFATAPDPFAVPSLEHRYRYRVLETKQFAP